MQGSDGRRWGIAPSAGAVAVVAALALTVTMNVLAVRLPLGGRSTGEISEMFPVLVTPADYAFGIWSLIYLGLTAFVVYQALPAAQTVRAVDPLRAPFIASCIFNVAWLLAWHYLLVELSLLLMVALLSSLIVLYRRMGDPSRSEGRPFSLLVRTPLTIYLGWVVVATAVNSNVLLYDLGWIVRGPAAQAAAVATVAIIATVSLLLLRRRRDPVFAGVVLWALAGIVAANLGAPAVAWSAAASAVVVAVGLYLIGRTTREGSGTII